LASEPSGVSASNTDAGEGREVRDASLPLPVRSGFAEQPALFREVEDLSPELRPLRGHLDPVFLRWSAARAEALGIDATLLILRSGQIDADAMLRIYAGKLDLQIDWLSDFAATGFDADKALASGELAAGIVKDGDRPTVAMFAGNTRTIVERAYADRESFRITSYARLRAFVERSAEVELAAQAAFGLQKRDPALSAASAARPRNRFLLVGVIAAIAAFFYVAPGPTRFVFEIFLAALFLSWASLRLFACLSREDRDASETIEDRELPVYSVLIPLYREAGVVSDLVASISALNYPREKLDVKLIVERDDEKTIDAVKAIVLDPCFEILYAPGLAPRTKPKALRAAMPFIRGEYVVIYDAEDRPERDQLRTALARFRAGTNDLACVQARLAIDNLYPAFLADHFRAEYAGLFDVLLPALERMGMRLPIPLGGTSNHFRVSVLREVGGWDPHNVTEDADLGVRLARFGYSTGTIQCTTWEEAPARLGAWLPQRTRWFQGWLQTYFVHMRNPLLLLRQLGWRGFFCFQILIGGSVLAALVHPIFAMLLLADSAWGSLLVPTQSPTQWTHKTLIFTTLTSGYIASGVLALTGMKRRGTLASAWVLLTLPVYWLLLSAAAWRAVWKLWTAPHQWEKTAHGVEQRSSHKA